MKTLIILSLLVSCSGWALERQFESDLECNSYLSKNQSSGSFLTNPPTYVGNTIVRSKLDVLAFPGRLSEADGFFIVPSSRRAEDTVFVSRSELKSCAQDPRNTSKKPKIYLFSSDAWVFSDVKFRIWPFEDFIAFDVDDGTISEYKKDRYCKLNLKNIKPGEIEKVADELKLYIRAEIKRNKEKINQVTDKAALTKILAFVKPRCHSYNEAGPLFESVERRLSDLENNSERIEPARTLR